MPNRISCVLPVAAILGLVLGMPAVAADGDYLFNTLKKPPYHRAWDALLASGGKVPAWLVGFGKGGNGVANPARTVIVEGQPYQLNFVCQAHNCGGNELHILFDAGATQAWGLLLEDGKSRRFLGNPDAAMRKVLEGDVNN